MDILDVKYKIQSDRKVKIKSKDEMLKDGVASPDIADALALTFYDQDNFSDRTVLKNIETAKDQRMEAISDAGL